MKKPLRKRDIRSVHYAMEVLFDHSTQDPEVRVENKKADPSETRILQLIAYVDQIKEARTDGYWSVLREL
jgi:hypothetical protein